MSHVIQGEVFGRRRMAGLLAAAGLRSPGPAYAAKQPSALAGFGPVKHERRFQLFDQVLASLARSEHGNLVFSPLCLADALAPLLHGARGATARDLAAVSEQIKRQVEHVPPTADETVLRCAAVWLPRSVHSVGPPPAQVKQLPADPAEAVNDVNAWVAEGTKGRIPSLLTRLPSNTTLLATSALYFSGIWQTQFRPEDTHLAPFRRLEGGSSQVPFMTAALNVRYARKGDLHAVALPYAGGKYELLVLAPTLEAAPRSVVSLVRSGSGLGAFQMLSDAAPRDVKVVLPRFGLRDGADLAPALRATEAAAMFAPGADFGGLIAEPVQVSGVVQQTVLQVDEKGTTAAAGTAAVMTRSLEPTPPTFRADAPFLVAVVSRTIDADLVLLAVALVTDPSKAQA